MRRKAMNLIFLGPPGAGKGTVAKQLSEEKQIPHISTGDLFREEIKNETELGKKVQKIISAGDLVPDELTTEIVKKRLSQPDAKNGVILDGFPRTIPQADALAEFCEIDGVLYFDISDEEVVKRLSGRRIAKKSGRIYHVEYNPPKTPGIDNETGEPLITRPDDQEDAVRNRLDVYKNQTLPLIEYYKSKEKLINIDASQSPDAVYKSVQKTVGSL
jgi:adenylate kinase